MFQTRREKILEARNKEIRLKEKTKVRRGWQIRWLDFDANDVLQGMLGLGGLGGKKTGGLTTFFSSPCFIIILASYNHHPF